MVWMLWRRKINLALTEIEQRSIPPPPTHTKKKLLI
jgi:hypothetical protein